MNFDSEDRKSMKKVIKDMSYVYKEDVDRYNRIGDMPPEEDYRHILNGDSVLTPKKDQLWTQFLIELKVHMEHGFKKNWNTHVVKGVRGHPWYTHTRGDGCFMCEDMNLMYRMYAIMCLIVEQYPDNRF